MSQYLQFLNENSSKLLEQLLEHIGLTFLSLLLAIMVAVPLGILISKKPKWASITLGGAGILQTIPSIALLGFMIPLLGIGFKPAIFALFIYALLPIIRNTYTGIKGVDSSVIEAAEGVGMSGYQIISKVEIPLALPVIFAGIRTSTVINVGVATLAAYIGAGGLGEFIFGGIALNNTNMILAGALPAALLAIFFDQLLALVQHMIGKGYTRLMIISIIILPIALSLVSFSNRIFTDQLTVAFDPEFYGRDDGYLALQKKYGVEFNTVLLSPSLMFEALHTGEVDLIAGYSTDGRVKAYDLVTLVDNLRAFPPYQCAALVNNSFYTQYPDAVKALNLLKEQISDSTMTALNYEVEHLERSIEEVAKKFLQSRGLWAPDRNSGGAVITIGSKLFSENYLMAEIFGQLIEGHTDYDVDTRHGLGGTKICFDALRQDEIDIYPEYTGTGFQVILSPSPNEVNNLIDDPEGVYHYVEKNFREQYDVHWLDPIGFNNTYALIGRRNQISIEGWHSISDLVD